MACQKGIRVMYSSHINIYSRTCDCVSYILNLPCEFLSGLLLLFEFVCPKVLKVLQGPMPSHDQVVRGSPLASFFKQSWNWKCVLTHLASPARAKLYVSGWCVNRQWKESAPLWFIYKPNTLNHIWIKKVTSNWCWSSTHELCY